MADKRKIRIDEGNPPKPSPVLTQAKRPASTGSIKVSNTSQVDTTNQKNAKLK